MQHSQDSSTNAMGVVPPTGSNHGMEESATAAAHGSVSERPMEMSIDDIFMGGSLGETEQINQIYQLLQQDHMADQQQQQQQQQLLQQQLQQEQQQLLQQQQQLHQQQQQQHQQQQHVFSSTNENSLQQEAFPSTNQKFPLQHQDFSSTNQEHSLQQKPFSLANQEFPLQRHDFLSTTQEHSLQQKSFSSANQDFPLQHHDFSSTNQEHSLQPQHFVTPNQETPLHSQTFVATSHEPLQQQTFLSTKHEPSLQQQDFSSTNQEQPMQQQSFTSANQEQHLQQQTFSSTSQKHSLQPETLSPANPQTYLSNNPKIPLRSQAFSSNNDERSIIQQEPFTSTKQELSFQQQQGQTQQQQEYTPGYNTNNVLPPHSSNYRNNPPDIDEASSMPFMHAVDPLSLVTEDTVPYSGSTHQSPVLSDYDTISALLEPSQRIHIDDDQSPESAGYNIRGDYDESPRKMSRVGTESTVDVDKLLSGEVSPISNENGVFTFQKFGMEIGVGQTHSIFSSSNGPQSRIADSHVSHDSSMAPITRASTTTPTISQATVAVQYDREKSDQTTAQYRPSPPVSPRRKRLMQKVPPLNDTFRDRHDNIILKILKQPEAQHRARYMTEGSRGAVKDTQQTGHPVVQLLGWSKEAKLEVFIGSDSGKVKPHGFYQVTRISGKNASASRERQQVDGTNVIEMEFDSNKNMTALIDCVGILKLRNTDVEKRIGPVKKKKNNTKCRLIYRVNLCLPSGKLVTLQTASSVIACTQPAGQPEICRMSLDKAPVDGGGLFLFVIGKNFIKNFQVKFQQLDKNSNSVIWERRSEVDSEYIQTTHFICTVPAYTNATELEPVIAQVVVETTGGVSEPMLFTYQPEQIIKPEMQDIDIGEVMSDPCTASTSSTAYPLLTTKSTTASPPPAAADTATDRQESLPVSIVSPEALELVAQLQQQSNGSSSRIFQIPEGVDFISQDTGNVGHRTSCDWAPSSGDFKPITINNRVISSSHFQTGAPLPTLPATTSALARTFSKPDFTGS